MALLDDWNDGAPVIVSCPGPLRRNASALQPLDTVALPQVLLGSESQLLAFGAYAALAEPGLQLFFARFPEMFAGTGAVRAALGRPGQGASGTVTHLRFGGVRAARVLKGARNAAVLAEQGGPALLTASHHPFATGKVLPACMQRVFGLSADVVRPGNLGGGVLPMDVLPPGLVLADLRGPDPSRAAAGLEVTGLVGFQSDAWAAGAVPGGACPANGQQTVLMPWNLDHPGSIVPELLARLASLGAAQGALPRIVLLPFNYIGQTGIIRDVIARIREASSPAGTLLPSLFLARVRTLDGVGALTGISRTAWVDGNDPEHWWTLARLEACGIGSVLIDPGHAATPPGTARVAADEALWVEAETRCGMLIFPARLPSLRALPLLLELTAAKIAETGMPARKRTRRRVAAG